MKSLDKIAGLGIEMAEKDLTTVEGGKTILRHGGTRALHCWER